MKSSSIFLVLYFVMSAPLSLFGQQQSPEKKGSWQLVWADEFNQPGRPDPKNWNYEKVFVRNQ